MDISAVVLSAKPVTLEIPGLTVVPHVSRFTEVAGLLDARIAALDKIESEWFFYLDDDDELPPNYLDVLQKCLDTGAAVAYTNELVRHASGAERVRRSGPYSQDAHVDDYAYLHHLVLCRTSTARRAARTIPRGEYGAEPLLFFQAAKEGAAWVDEVGYIWNVSGNGLSSHPSLLIGLVQSVTWAHRNRV